MIYILFLFVGVCVCYWLNRRKHRRLREENAIRERLGLPPLTLSQFSVTVVEKSKDFRSNINQHM